MNGNHSSGMTAHNLHERSFPAAWMGLRATAVGHCQTQLPTQPVLCYPPDDGTDVPLPRLHLHLGLCFHSSPAFLPFQGGANGET